MESATRVLHVDDEPEFVDLTTTYLERADDRIETLTATSGQKALETLEENEVDCVVSDYEMPGMNGLELLRAVRQRHPDLPFILFTGKGSEEVASDAISAGVTDYLQKETGSDQYTVLANRVLNAVHRQRAESELKRKTTLLSTLFDALPAGVLAEDGERNVLEVNEQHLELFGIDASPEEVIGRNAGEIVEQVSDLFADSESFVSRTDELFENEQEVRNEELALTDGRTLMRTHTVIDLPTGKGYLWMYQDLTEYKEHKETLQRREETLTETSAVLADHDRSTKETIDALLEIGREMIGTDYATFSYVHGDTYEFELVDAPPDIDLDPGSTTRREELPICDRVVRTEQTLVIQDVDEETPELADPTWGVSCYLGAPVVVDGEVYGTFCFYDTEARSEAFSEWQTTYVELLSDWVGLALSSRED